MCKRKPASPGRGASSQTQCTWCPSTSPTLQATGTSQGTTWPVGPDPESLIKPASHTASRKRKRAAWRESTHPGKFTLAPSVGHLLAKDTLHLVLGQLEGLGRNNINGKASEPWSWAPRSSRGHRKFLGRQSPASVPACALEAF